MPDKVPATVPAVTQPKAPMFHTPQEYERHITKIEKEYALAIQKVTAVATGQSPASPVQDGVKLLGTAGSQLPSALAQQLKEPPPEGPPTPLQQMHRLMEKAGEQGFDARTVEILSEPIDDALVDVKPNGAIFVSHIHYRDRLDRAFGPGGWALIPLAMPKMENNRVVWFGFLKAGGQYIENAMGGCSYIPSNKEMNYDDCIEGAKSDCLARCCKALPMFRECWDRSYGDYWKATFAEQGYNKKWERYEWKKKGEAKPNWTARPERSSESEFKKPASLDKENLQHLNAIAKEGTLRAMPDTDWPEEHE
jgi:Mitochondrial genome maintenance MGM101